MIHFDASVRIVIVNWALFPVLVNTSMWSNWKRVDVCVAALKDSSALPEPGGAAIMAIALEVDSNGSADAARLAEYLTKHLPNGYSLAADGGRVNISWSPAVARAAPDGQRRKS